MFLINAPSGQIHLGSTGQERKWICLVSGLNIAKLRGEEGRSAAAPKRVSILPNHKTSQRVAQGYALLVTLGALEISGRKHGI